VIRLPLVSSLSMRLRFASGIALVTLGTLGLFGVAGGGACTFPEDEAKPDVAFIDPDTTSDTGPTLGNPTVFVDGADQPADLECRGKPRDAGPINDADLEVGPDTTVAGGQIIPITIDMYAFGTGNTEKIPNMKFDVFYGNTMTDDKTPDLVDVTTDDAGRATFSVPAGYRVAYRIKPVVDPDPKKALDPYYEFDQLIPLTTGAVIEFAGMRHQEFSTLTLAVTGKTDFPQFPGTGIFATRVTDCKRHYMRNVQVDIIDGDGPTATYSKCTEGLCRLYLSDLELPAFGSDATSRAGLVAFVGVPVTSATHHVRAVARARLPGTSDIAVIATRDLEIREGAVNVAFLEP
jgi:hypothetical protein